MKKVTLSLLISALVGTSAIAADAATDTTPVSLGDFVRAETDHMIRSNMARFNAEPGKFVHIRKPAAIDQQTVIRMNQDTLYSVLILDLSKPATITLPEIGGRYQAMQIIDQDHYTTFATQPGTYTLTQEEVGSRYVFVSLRTLADPNNAADVAAANAAQDKVVVETPIVGGELDLPDWDTEQLAEIRSTLNSMLKYGVDANKAFGTKDEVEPIAHLLGAAIGWGALPPQAAQYLSFEMEDSADMTPYTVTAKDVPVDAFWSVTVYNKEGYMQENELGRNSFNNLTADKNSDGSITIHFGACEDGRVNCVPITEGWNYTVRLYGPQQPILDGEWEFPQPVKVQ